MSDEIKESDISKEELHTNNLRDCSIETREGTIFGKFHKFVSSSSLATQAECSGNPFVKYGEWCRITLYVIIEREPSEHERMSVDFNTGDSTIGMYEVKHSNFKFINAKDTTDKSKIVISYVTRSRRGEL